MIVKQTTTNKGLQMKNKVIAILGITALLVSLTACGNKDSQSSDLYVAPQQQDVNPSDESGYIQSVRSMGNEVLATGSVSQLLEMGYNVCNALDNGETVTSIYLTVSSQQDSSAGKEAAAVVIAGAVLYLCPEYKYQADSLTA